MFLVSLRGNASQSRKNRVQSTGCLSSSKFVIGTTQGVPSGSIVVVFLGERVSVALHSLKLRGGCPFKSEMVFQGGFPQVPCWWEEGIGWHPL